MKYISDGLYKKINNLINLPREIMLRRRARVVLQQSFTTMPHFSPELAKEIDLVLMTVAFNNVDTIKLQSQLLKKNITDKYQYIVIDNSSSSVIAIAIQDFCTKQKIPYFRLVSNPYNGIDGSRSHGLALNWAYRQVVSRLSPRYFGIIDHDIFPIKHTSIIKKLKSKPFYGLPQSRGQIWYLWPGYSFFSMKILNKINPNFAPIPGTDTGGGNYPLLYKNYEEKSLTHPVHGYLYLDVAKKSKVEVIDNWIHIIAASGWSQNGKVKDVKSIMQAVMKRLNK